MKIIAVLLIFQNQAFLGHFCTFEDDRALEKGQKMFLYVYNYIPIFSLIAIFEHFKKVEWFPPPMGPLCFQG